MASLRQISIAAAVEVPLCFVASRLVLRRIPLVRRVLWEMSGLSWLAYAAMGSFAKGLERAPTWTRWTRTPIEPCTDALLTCTIFYYLYLFLIQPVKLVD